MFWPPISLAPVVMHFGTIADLISGATGTCEALASCDFSAGLYIDACGRTVARALI